MNKPLITIITVCYNASKYIEETILSVINQTYSNIEYIIIDGGSTDGTVDIIKKYADKIAYWVSEPDKGIYDAMNKGIVKASGEWINFMNSGDTFFSNETISLINFEKAINSLIIYGDNINILNDNINTYRKASKLTNIKYGMIFCHQSSFVRNTNNKDIIFDSHYKICADYNLFLGLYNKYGTKCFFYFPFPIAKYDNIYGISTNYKFNLYLEKITIHYKNKYYFSIIIDIIIYLLIIFKLK